MQLNEYFDRIICINLKERQDKKEIMSKRFLDLGINVEGYHPVIHNFVDKIVPSINKDNSGKFNINNPREFSCSLSHYHVIKSAFLDGVEKLFVFEDDVFFHKDFAELFPKYMDKAPEDGDCLMLYSFMYKILPENTRTNSRGIKAFKSGSLTSYAINRKFMEGYIKKQDNFFTIADLVSLEMQEEGYNVYVTTPCLCLPDCEMGSNIRTVQNYKTNPTVLNLGVSDSNYLK